MVEKAKKHKKGTISEGDVSTLLQRYSATTVLSLLQEVAQVPEVKIDWNALVKKTATGISNAREYQMLWRHLAYCDSMVDRLDDEAEPLDDDSDLDYELEAIPPVSSEASTEATACVKVLISSGSQSDTSLPNGLTVEAPLTINIPNGEPFRAPSENSQLQGTNITIPVTVQKQPLPTVTSSEGLDANGSASGNLPPRRKRKPWSAAEDLELIAAVKKCGEGNWANILKGDFKGDRTASQLSQRWAIIRKRQGNSNISSGSQLSEAQLAARRAVSIALNMPMVDNLTAACSNAGTNPNTMPGNTASPAATEASVGVQSQQQSRQDCAPTSLSKPRVPAKKPSIIKPVLSPDAMVKAAAVAAGARIATPSDAASLLKAAQSKNAVHIMPGGSSLVKSSVGGNASALPPNVHFIRTGLAPVQHSAYPAAATNASRSGGTLQAQNNSPKPVAPTVQLHSTRTAVESNPSAVATNVIASSSASDLKADDIINSVPSNPPKEQIQENQVTIPGREQVQETGAAALGNALEEKVQNDQVSVSSSPPKEQSQDQASALSNAPNEQVQEDQTALPSSDGQDDFVEDLKCSSSPNNPADCQTVTTSAKAVTGSGSEKGDDEMMICTALEQGSENQSMVEVVPESQILDVKQTDLAGTGRDGSDENMEVAD